MDLQERYLSNPKINAFDISIIKGKLKVLTYKRENEDANDFWERHNKNVSTARKIFKRI